MTTSDNNESTQLRADAPDVAPTSIELFAGAGGLALGLHAAGFHAAALVERDPFAAATLRAAALGPVIEADARGLDLSTYRGADLLAAGFPCQPFSHAGKRQGADDERDGWPSTRDAIDQVRPLWALLENVPGLTTHSKKGHPDPRRCPGCYFAEILAALRERFAFVDWRILCAADFGVPQRRYRLFIVAGPVPFPWPAPTHSEEALAEAKWISGAYWRALEMAPAGEPSRREARLLRDRHPLPLFQESAWRLQPWRTVREALGIGAAAQDLGGGSNPREAGREQIGNAGPWLLDPDQRIQSVDAPSHTLCAAEAGGGAVSTYLLIPHDSIERTGSLDTSVDIPARSLRAQPGRALAIEERGVSRRRLTWQECALLQDFPADHPFQGPKTRIYHQVGNAAPRRFGLVLGLTIRALAQSSEQRAAA